MKRNHLVYTLLLMALFIMSCSEDEEIVAPPQNQNPGDFSIEVTQITVSSALLKWNPAIDPDNDKVTYTVFLQNIEVVSDIETTEFLLQDLEPQTSYTGVIMASDGKTGITESTFLFSTIENTSGEIGVVWQKSLGGDVNDAAYVIRETDDGGYIIGGVSESDNGDVSENKGGKDCWVVKLDNAGNIVWEKNFGGTQNETIHDIQLTNDGGYIVGAFSTSNDGDVSENNGMRDFWIVKLNGSGDIMWETNVGGASDDILESIIQAADGGYIASGFSSSDEVGVDGQSDAWIVKLDALGNLLWETNIGGPQRDIAASIANTLDQGFVVAGYTETSENKREVWMAKFDGEGMLDWQNTYGGSDDDEAVSVQQTSEGGYIIAGYSESIDGDVTENKGSADGWIIKTNSVGGLMWQKTYGGMAPDGISDIQQTNDGGYIATGSSSSSDGDTEENNGATDFWVLRLNASGTIVWQKNLGDEGNDYAFSIRETQDQGYVVAGSWYTNIMGNGEGTTGDFNYWVVKLQ